MAGATISFSPMEKRWFVRPGQGRATLTFDSEPAAKAAKAALDAGKPLSALNIGIDVAAAGADKTIFFPSRSSKSGPFTGYEAEVPMLQHGRPMPKSPGRSFAAFAAAMPAPPARKKNGRAQIDIAKARIVYAETGSLERTARCFGVGFETLRRHFRKAGVPINPAIKPSAR